jgi:hypothetical protein
MRSLWRRELPAKQRQDLNTMCIFLGPYRNLTTLTASVLSLHESCQVLNHSGDAVFADPRLNFIVDYSDRKFHRFCRFAMTESSSSGDRNEKGSIQRSHAFRRQAMRETYERRHGEQEGHRRIRCLVWKESLRVSNLLREQGIPVEELLRANSKLRFLMPVRNPLDCAVSNCETGMNSLFSNLHEQDLSATLDAIMAEFAWFRGLQQRWPERFFAYCQNEFNRDLLVRLAAFLEIAADEDWISDSLQCYQLKASYEHSAEAKSRYHSLVQKHFDDDAEFAGRLASLVQ